MSGIINKMIKHKKAATALFLLLVITAILLIFGVYLPAAMIITITAANELTVRKINKQEAPFGANSKIRNVDCLVIGDIPPKAAQRLSERDKIVSIYLPDCTLAGAYEVLRHTFSILKETGGTAILIVKKKYIGKTGYSPFDVCFFHPVTINRLGLKNAKYTLRLPIIFAPVKSLMFLTGIKVGKPKAEYCDKEIENFCEERGMEVKILEV